MIRSDRTRASRVRRHARIRRKVAGDAGRPRLSVYRSNRHIYAQLIDDLEGRTLVAASSLEPDGRADGQKTATAKAVGQLLARKARDAGIERAVLDRGGRLYHGRVRSLAEGAREGGLQI